MYYFWSYFYMEAIIADVQWNFNFEITWMQLIC